MNTDVIEHGDPKQSDQAHPAGEEFKQSSSPTTMIGNNPASDSTELAPPFIFSNPWDTLVEGPPITSNGQVIRTHSYNPVGQLVVDPMTVTLAGTDGAGLGAFGDQSVSGSRITSIIGDQPITAAPVAVTFAGTTLTPGAPGKTMNGTLIGLNIPRELVSGTKTVPFEIGGADLGKLIMGGFGAGGPLVSTPPSPITRGSSNGTRNTTTNADGAVFLGEAESLRKSGLLFWKTAAISAIAIAVLSRFNWWSSLC